MQISEIFDRIIGERPLNKIQYNAVLAGELLPIGDEKNREGHLRVPVKTWLLNKM